ncbi:MAG: hypothetical protein LBU88_09615 [Treponema sp.]|nr:hypothetical protein [Treponema sp.]
MKNYKLYTIFGIIVLIFGFLAGITACEQFNVPLSNYINDATGRSIRGTGHTFVTKHHPEQDGITIPIGETTTININIHNPQNYVIEVELEGVGSNNATVDVIINNRAVTIKIINPGENDYFDLTLIITGNGIPMPSYKLPRMTARVLVASITIGGETEYYNSFTAAITAAITAATDSDSQDPVTITLWEDINLGIEGSYSFTIPSGKHIVLTTGSNVVARIVRNNVFGGNLFIVESNSSLTLNGSLTIDGNGDFIQFESLVSIKGNFTISDNVHLTNNSGSGVQVENSGTFIMDGGTISGHYTDTGKGGGVFVEAGTFTMNGGTILENTAYRGGGVYVAEDGIFTMNGGQIKDNKISSPSGVAGTSLCVEQGGTAVYGGEYGEGQYGYFNGNDYQIIASGHGTADDNLPHPN